MTIRKYYDVLRRKKPLDSTTMSETKLARVLTTLDLTLLGIGSTLGVGVYVVAGTVSKENAGPAVVLSFLIAAVASVFAGLCYAEFGARVPKAGSAYVYSYVCVGEFIAFVIGWNLILEYAIGSASVAKGLSTYLDSLLNNTMKGALSEVMPMNVDFMSTYPDFFAFGITALFSFALAFGAKESTMMNNIFTVLNLLVVLFVIIAGSFKADPANWRIPADEVPEGYGDGGFAPYGFTGIVKGAAVCFYGFIGFDCVATAGEEAKNPKKSIPIAVVASLFVIFLAYFSISTVLTMMWPYYDQDTEAPLPYVFKKIDWTVAQYIVSIGAMFGLCSSLMGAMFPLPRIIYAMSSDGLLFAFMGRIHPRFHTPLVGTLLAGLLTGLMSMLFNLEQLINMMSIGTLMAYSMVAACVLLLRYEIDPEDPIDEKEVIGFGSIFAQILNRKRLQRPTKLTSVIVTWAVTLYCVWCLCISACITIMGEEILSGDSGAIVALALFSFLLIFTMSIVWAQPMSSKKLSFTVPFLPWLPACSILINIYLMLMLDSSTWIRFIVWIVIGLVIYFSYGLWNSNERRYKKKQIVELEQQQNKISTSSQDVTTFHKHGTDNNGFEHES